MIYRPCNEPGIPVPLSVIAWPKPTDRYLFAQNDDRRWLTVYSSHVICWILCDLITEHIIMIDSYVIRYSGKDRTERRVTPPG